MNERNEFKVGDWVVGEDICRKSKKSTTISRLKEARKPSQFAWPYILENGSYCAKIKKWEPKVDDWVIPDTGIDKDIFVVMKYNGVSLIPSRCRPFFGELPYES